MHCNRGDTFQMIIFDPINGIFKYWFKLEFCYFNYAVHAKLFKIIVKGCKNFGNMPLLYKEL